MLKAVTALSAGTQEACQVDHTGPVMSNSRLFSTFLAASAVSAGAHGACDVEFIFVLDIAGCFGVVCGSTQGLRC
jgi:hypothetical protein